ncbi:type II secretion system F family protein [uncultured Methanobrevibacter sp.]|uniref:type II secretion system F family protein n=1 Tax=uncultured Methanobrevibacter sp. TaxID=253161 RepID=UPI0025E3B1BD|nr:type II secretion system F family protein [uncultured Methanobrevibacter sp.]
MFDKLFINVGNIILVIYNFFINFKFPSFDFSKKSDVKGVDISEIQMKDRDRFNKFRSRFINNFLSKKVMAVLLILVLIIYVFIGLEISLMFVVLCGMFYLFMKIYPQMKQKRSYSDLNLELPYALRHMGIELKSGKGLHDTLITVANANYGSFSRELTRVLEQVRYGESTENALIEMSSRVNSDGLSRSVQQIVGTLRVGGNLANSLAIIADDISFDMHVKLKDYSQRLNAFILIYTFVAILAPVILLIMLMAASTVMGDIIPSNIIMVMYVVLFPMIVVFMGILIKKLEPEI